MGKPFQFSLLRMLAAVAGFCVAARLVVGVTRGDLHPAFCMLAFALSLTLGFGQPSLFSWPRMLCAIAAFAIATQMLVGVVHGGMGTLAGLVALFVSMTVGITEVVENWIAGIVVAFLATFAVLALISGVH